jgi:tRNA threonylcarbamoyladenosine biosynthesis protein TsaE
MPQVVPVTRTLSLPTLDDTMNFGRALGTVLVAGDLVILSGALGAGKTALTKGIGAGMGVRGTVASPTFVLARVHPATAAGTPLVHVDAYRIAGAVELDDLDLDTDLTAAAVVIEWGQSVAEQLSDERLLVRLERLPDDGREATLTAFGERWADRVATIVP